MHEVKVPDDLWATSIMPEGVLERWIIADGAVVKAGEAIAALRIEQSLHEILATSAGRISFVLAANGVVEPGTLLARIDPSAGAEPAGPSHSAGSSDKAALSYQA